MFDGKLAKYLDDPGKAKALAQALKIAINSVYGLTAAKFDNAFRNPLNIDNIVAKRGALFMIDLRHAVEEQGYKVIHIKTDSIKIENPDDYIPVSYTHLLRKRQKLGTCGDNQWLFADRYCNSGWRASNRL